MIARPLAHSFYAEVAAAKATPTKVAAVVPNCSTTTSGCPIASSSPLRLATARGSRRSPVRHYYRKRLGLRPIDRPMMLAMCQGIVADFDERSGNYRAATENPMRRSRPTTRSDYEASTPHPGPTRLALLQTVTLGVPRSRTTRPWTTPAV
jgi:hypothetical protein